VNSVQYCIIPDANEHLVLLPGKQLILSDPPYNEGSADLSDAAGTGSCFNRQVFGATPQAPSQRGGTPLPLS
jgi:hypothetical protein